MDRIFFSKANLENINEQSFIEKKLYSFFSRVNSTIYFTFSYNQTIGFDFNNKNF